MRRGDADRLEAALTIFEIVAPPAVTAKRGDVVLPLVSALLQTEWSPAVEVRKLEAFSALAKDNAVPQVAVAPILELIFKYAEVGRSVWKLPFDLVVLRLHSLT